MDPDTAYRYYSAWQLRDARLIDALRRAGIPLAEITLLLRDRDPARLGSWAGHVRADAARRQEASRWRAACSSPTAPEPTLRPRGMPCPP